MQKIIKGIAIAIVNAILAKTALELLASVGVFPDKWLFQQIYIGKEMAMNLEPAYSWLLASVVAVVLIFIELKISAIDKWFNSAASAKPAGQIHPSQTALPDDHQIAESQFQKGFSRVMRIRELERTIPQVQHRPVNTLQESQEREKYLKALKSELLHHKEMTSSDYRLPLVHFLIEAENLGWLLRGKDRSNSMLLSEKLRQAAVDSELRIFGRKKKSSGKHTVAEPIIDIPADDWKTEYIDILGAVRRGTSGIDSDEKVLWRLNSDTRTRTSDSATVGSYADIHMLKAEAINWLQRETSRKIERDSE